MIYGSLIFWLVLMLPGWVVVRWFDLEDPEAGFLAIVGLSYVASLVVLSPVSIVCYAARLPIWVFSISFVVVIVAAVVVISWRGWWRELAKILVSGLCLESIFLAGDLVLALRTGAFMGVPSDIGVHLARIRYLLDHGFSDFHPAVGAEQMLWVYHTNLLHALHAACANITRVDHLGVWFVSLAWAKLVIAGGVYFMVWRLFASRWAAWLAVIFQIGLLGPISFAVYPNKLSAHWLIPVTIGCAMAVARRRVDWRVPAALAGCALVLGQVHSLYAFFAAVSILPGVFLVIFLAGLRKVRKDPEAGPASSGLLRISRPIAGWKLALWCAAAFATAAPFVGIAEYGRSLSQNSNVRPTADSRSESTETPSADSVAMAAGETGWMLTPGSALGKCGALKLGMLGLGLIYVVAGPRRDRALVLGIAVFGVTAVLFLVPLRSAAVAFLGAEWVLLRSTCIVLAGILGLSIGSMAVALETALKGSVLRAVAAAFVLLFGVQMNAPVPGLPECSWRGYLELAAANAETRFFQLERLRLSRDFFRRHIPPGSRVLAREGGSAECLVICHDAFVVLGRGEGRDSQRAKDLNMMLSPAAPIPIRLALLDEYGIRHFLVDSEIESFSGWVAGFGETFSPGPGPGPWPGQWTRLVVLTADDCE